MKEQKIKALANFLEVEEDEINQSSYNENLFKCGSQEYLVCTNKEANQEAKDYILESLWAFNTDFILDHSKIKNYNDEIKKVFKKMQEKLCEDANGIIKAIIEDLYEFIEDAISADGRGNFLSGYDGEENEEGQFYIYRIN